MENQSKIKAYTVKDIRFPTSLEKDGSDAINKDPDYSCAYVQLQTDTGLSGFGLTFTTGRGTELVCQAVKLYSSLLVGKTLSDIYSKFGKLWSELTQEPQLRWLGPEKGVTHIALAAVINALWDLWAKVEGKPLWKLLVDLDLIFVQQILRHNKPKTLIKDQAPAKVEKPVKKGTRTAGVYNMFYIYACIYHYRTDFITEKEAIQILRKAQSGKDQREKEILKSGYPAYTTSAGWLGYSDVKIKKLCKEALQQGFTRFKVKVGLDQEDDIRRVGLIRNEIGSEKMLMTDANQRWEVEQAIEWMKSLALYKPVWIEEPTCPDDILGHATISEALEPYGIGVATGEACQNRVMFKQFLQAKAFQFCQIDSCRMAGPNEILAVYLMAFKAGVPVCPHAGGVGLCELVQHLQMFDYIALSGTKENRVVEYVDHLHEHFKYPVVVQKGSYMASTNPGYSTEMKEASLSAYEYPCGSVWQDFFDRGVFPRPT